MENTPLSQILFGQKSPKAAIVISVMNNICHPHFVQTAQNKHIRPEIMPTYERKLPALVPIPQDIYTRNYTNVYLCCQHGGRCDGSEKVRFHHHSIQHNLRHIY